MSSSSFGGWSKQLLFLVGTLFLIQPTLGAQEERIELKWNQLGNVVSGREILTILTNGKEVEGRVLSVQPEVLQIEVSNGSAGYSKGLNSIPRSQVSVLQIEKTEGIWRALGAAIGGGAGTAAGVAVFSRLDNEGNPEAGGAVAAGLIGGGAALGFFLGRFADRRSLIISVID